MKNYQIIKNEVGIVSKKCLECGYETKTFSDLTDQICSKCKTMHRNKIDIFETILRVEEKIRMIEHHIADAEIVKSDLKYKMEELQGTIDFLENSKDKLQSIKYYLEDLKFERENPCLN